MMLARLDSVCKFICERGNWRVTNLQLQKILYMAQMYYMGRHDGEPLTQARFQAWDFGPVDPSVYKKVRMFGSGPIQDVFFEARPFREDDERRHDLQEVCDSLLPMRPGALVDITHWPNGAWAKYYVPGIKGIEIPNDDIAAEYHARLDPEQR